MVDRTLRIVRSTLLSLALFETHCQDKTVQGPAGPAGAVGQPGQNGASGTTGTDGANGTNGAAGGVGAQGPPGSQGPPGPTGDGISCGTNAVLSGSVCVRATCLPPDQNLNCALASGGVGRCFGVNCLDVDLSTDANNCGYLGGVCGAGASCVDGFCVVSSNACDNTGDCAPGLACFGGACQNGISCSASNCPVGLSCDTTLDNTRCDLPTCGAGDDYRLCQANPSPFLGWPDFCCSASCVSLLSDNNNCGYCGHVCPGNAACYLGACETDCGAVPDNTLCNDGAGYCCGGSCTTTENADTCSACGVGCPSCSSSACPAGQACVEHRYVGVQQVCEPTDCSAVDEGSVCAVSDLDAVVHQGECCAGSCTNLATDAQNCGVCGRTCPTHQVCLDSECVPEASCTIQSEGALCHLASGDTGTCCGGSCVDVATDNANCTGCALACPVDTTCTLIPASADAPLRSGQCQDAGAVVSPPIAPLSCAGLDDNTSCDTGSGAGKCCAGACTDVGSDSNNCFACGVACPSGTTCSTSVFQSPTTACVDAPDEPVSCGPTHTCPAGTICNGFCLPTSCSGRSNGDICAFGAFAGTCCGEQCVSALQDPNNCGGCGLQCDGGLCLLGVCQTTLITGCVPACPSDTLCYQMLDPYDTSKRVPICLGPVCGHFGGEAFWLNSEQCLADDQQLGTCCGDGACANLANDPENCGACGVSCHGQACVGGSCTLAACDFRSQNGFCGAPGDFTSLCCGTSCVDSASDPANCGRCAMVCHKDQTCQAGVCQ